MSAAGWMVFVTAVSGITGLLIWCVQKIVRTPAASAHLHSPADIDTGDADE